MPPETLPAPLKTLHLELSRWTLYGELVGAMLDPTMQAPEEILDFWFEGSPALDARALGRKLTRWYSGGPAMDAEVAARFGDAVERALAGDFVDWEQDVTTRLALILVLDQFPRGMFRDAPRAYAGDARAQRLALMTLDAGEDRSLWLEQRLFVLMPLLHAEDEGLQDRCEAEARRLQGEAPAALQPLYGMSVEQATKYRDIIRRFGRFPHRNAILGRSANAQEIAFMESWAEQAAPSGMSDLRAAERADGAR